MSLNNKKNLGALAFSVISLVTVGIIYFTPIVEIPGSFETYKEAKAEINNLNKQKLDLNNQLNTLRVDTKNKEIELVSVKDSSGQAEKLFGDLLKEQEDSGDWSLHLPSLLIELEAKADDSKVKLAIDYSTISGEGAYVSSSEQGLKVVTAKVDIYGEYNSVNNYIKSIEDIDFLAVENIILNRVENGDLAGSYYLSIYYMD